MADSTSISLDDTCTPVVLSMSFSVSFYFQAHIFSHFFKQKMFPSISIYNGHFVLHSYNRDVHVHVVKNFDSWYFVLDRQLSVAKGSIPLEEIKPGISS